MKNTKKLSLTNIDIGFQGFLGTPTGCFTESNEEVCVGDIVSFFPKGDRHDIMSGLVTENDGLFYVRVPYSISLSIIDVVKITNSHKEFKVGDKCNRYGNFKIDF